jgi:hypothetical protein
LRNAFKAITVPKLEHLYYYYRSGQMIGMNW